MRRLRNEDSTQCGYGHVERSHGWQQERLAQFPVARLCRLAGGDGGRNRRLRIHRLVLATGFFRPAVLNLAQTTDLVIFTAASAAPDTTLEQHHEKAIQIHR